MADTPEIIVAELVGIGVGYAVWQPEVNGYKKRLLLSQVLIVLEKERNSRLEADNAFLKEHQGKTQWEVAMESLGDMLGELVLSEDK